MKIYKKVIVLLAITIISSFSTLYAAPSKKYSNQWSAYNPLATKTIHYPTWKTFLKNYTISKGQQTYVQYNKVSKQSKRALNKAIKRLENLDIKTYNRNQQLAYWVNLYNMETVSLVLANYPVKSITKIKFSLLGFGPWDKKLLTVDGVKLSLNDIEHHIIRPIWNDPRIHAAVNCASISCPNLLQVPFEGSKINQQLNQSFRVFVNSKKGVQIKGNTLQLSEIFKWYGVDFGNNNQEIKRFITYYIDSVKEKENILKAQNIEYQKYNWSLNEIGHD